MYELANEQTADNIIEEKADNAIDWIDNLPKYSQSPKGDRQRLGNNERGYCCLGAGCEILDIEFDEDDPNSEEFQQAVGLYCQNGSFTDDAMFFYGKDSLTALNDKTNAGFKRISDFMKAHPDWVFEKKVAEIITKHYA